MLFSATDVGNDSYKTGVPIFEVPQEKGGGELWGNFLCAQWICLVIDVEQVHVWIVLHTEGGYRVQNQMLYSSTEFLHMLYLLLSA